MKTLIGVLCAFAAALCVWAATQTSSPAPGPAGEAPSRAGNAPVAAAAQPKRTVVVDLPAAPLDALTLTTPNGRHFFVVLKNTAPSGSYRVTYDWSVVPDLTRPPAATLHRQSGCEASEASSALGLST
jgi:hypothetical protein